MGLEQDKSAEIAFFDALTSSADYDVLSERGYQRILSEFRRHVPVRRPLRCLDLGCGSGEFTARLLPLGMELHGLDLSTNAIEMARRKHPRIEFRVGDIEDTGLPDGSFDVVVLSGVLHHFPDLSRVAKECARVLAPEGRLLAYDPHRGNPFMWAYRCKASPFYSSDGVTENEQPIARATILGALGEAGFRSVDVYPISGVSFKFVASGLARLALPAYNLLDRVLDLSPLRSLGSFLITVAVR